MASPRRWTFVAERRISKREAQEILRELVSGEAIVSDRYSALGPPNGCRGPCEGTGYVPIRPGGPTWDWKDDTSRALREAWFAAEAEKHAPDGYHFLRCPDCNAGWPRA